VDGLLYEIYMLLRSSKVQPNRPEMQPSRSLEAVLIG
jgi:hypothetical protein